MTGDGLALSTGELKCLTDTANSEHRATFEAVQNAVGHAIACGEALIAIRTLLPLGTWSKWVEDNLDFTLSVASKYLRLATHRELLGDQRTIYGAMAHLSNQGLPNPNRGNARRPPLDDLEIAEAKAMHATGMGYTKIAARFGCSGSYLQAQLDPAFAKRQTERGRVRGRLAREARKLLRAKHVAEQVAKIGGDASIAYASVRKAALAIDKAIASAADNDTKDLLARALDFAHKAEGEIVFAMKIERRTDRRPLPVRAESSYRGRAPGDRRSAS
jgi:hypothetical protein